MGRVQIENVPGPGPTQAGVTARHLAALRVPASSGVGPSGTSKLNLGSGRVLATARWLDEGSAVLAEQVDLKALQGTGSNSQPTGVLNAGISSLTWGGADSPLAYSTTRFWWNDALLSEKTSIDSKAHKGKLSWLCDSASWQLMQHRVSSNDEHMTLVDGQGRVLNHPITPTTHMPANTVLFGNWQDLVMGVWGGIALAADGGGDNFAKGDL